MTYTPRTVWIGGPPPAQPKAARTPRPKAIRLRPMDKREQAPYARYKRQQARDALIVQMRNEGDQYCDIAMIANISKARCQQIYTTFLQRAVV